MKNTLKRGFTLVELLVVVLIIGILSSVALPQYTKAVKKAKGVKIITATDALVKAMNMAYLEDGQYSRYYSSSDNGGRGSDVFDIEIPAVKRDNSCLEIWAEPDRTRAYVVAVGDGEDNYRLEYYLSDGKLNSITCSGPGCKAYFPGTILSSN